MPLVFPTNSSIGATYDYGGIHYIYDGNGWVNKSIYGISAGSNISFANYNGTGPLVISASSTGGGITSAVTSINGLSGAVGISAGQDMSISIVGNTLAFSSPTVYGISANIYASSLATGLLHGGIISINAGNTARFDITSGRGQIHASGSTYTADPQPTFNYVTWPAQTGITVTNLATSDTTWLYIDSSGNVQQRTEYYTDEQLETTIIIGQLVHPSRTYINLARTNPNVAYATDKQYEQFIRSFGPIKVSGHSISPNGANLKLNRTSGKAFSLGRNWINNTDDPSVVSDPAQTDCTFFRYYRGVTAGTFITVPNQTAIDPTKYDNGSGTLATVPGGKYTIQRLFYYPNTPTLLGVYYGRAEYNSISVAAANIDLENFSEIENTRTNAIFAGYLIVKSGATDLTNTADALIIQAGSFRSTSSGGGSVSITLDDLTDVIISSPINYQVLTYVDGVTGWENRSVSQLPLVYSFNGLSGAVQGVSAAVAGTGISVSGATGSVTITNTGVLSFNGNTGAVQGVSSINGATGAITNVAKTNTAQTFSGLQSFSTGISASYVKTDSIDSANLSITPSFLGVGSATIKLKQDNGLNQYFTTISGAGSAASSDRTITLPDDNGTVALTKNIVSSFNGLTGAVQGVSSAVAGTGISVSGATGSVTITNIGVLSFNGLTGAVQGVSSINGNTGAISNVAFINVAQTFTETQHFSQGLTAADVVEFYADTSYFYPTGKGNRYVSITPGPLNYVSANGNSALVLNQNNGNAVYIGDYDVNNNGTYITIEDNAQTISFNYSGIVYRFPTSVGSANQVLTTDGVNQLSWTTISGSGGGVSSFNGLTGAVQGVSAAIGGTGISVSGATGSVTITNTGVRSFNGSTGDVTYNALSRYIASISTNTTAGSTANTDFVYVCTAGLTLTLPTAVSNTNRYSVKNTSSSVVKVFTTSSQAIDGITSGYNLTRQYQAIDVISDGSNWFVI